jgi:hypothetical protein
MVDTSITSSAETKNQGRKQMIDYVVSSNDSSDKTNLSRTHLLKKCHIEFGWLSRYRGGSDTFKDLHTRTSRK